MTAATSLRKGWCPGALRPMRSGDGLLVRVRPRAGLFYISALERISAVAARFGTGDIDLTNRGNLQIRGIADETFESTLAALDEADLLDASPEVEAVRNVVVDPLSGPDPERADVRDLAADLEATIVHDARLSALPGKFGFSFSGVPNPRVSGRSADIMISVVGDRAFVWLDGAEDICSDIPRGEAVDAGQRLALAFLEIHQNELSIRRMRDAVSRLGAATIFAMAGSRAFPRTVRSDASAPVVGMLVRNDCTFAVGVGFPFGRARASEIGALCKAAAAANVDRVHMSTERSLVFPVGDAQRAALVLDCADSAGLITRSDDIRLAIDVCPGSPACRNASTDTRGDAQRFAKTFEGSLGGSSLHISGCEKGCARRSDASLTLVGREGHYDVIRDGTADSSRVDETIAAGDITAAISRLLLEPTT